MVLWRIKFIVKSIATLPPKNDKSKRVFSGTRQPWLLALNLSKTATITEIKEIIDRYSKIIISNFVILTPIYVNLVLLFRIYYNIIIYKFQPLNLKERKVHLGNFDSSNSKRAIITVVISIIIIICTTAVGIIGIISPETLKSSSGSISNVNAAADSSSKAQSALESSDVMSTESLSSFSQSSSNISSVDSSLESSSNGQTSSEVTSSKVNSSLVSSTPSGTVSSETTTPPVTNKSFTSAMWYSYSSDMNFKNLTEQQFKNKINKMFDDAVDLGNDAVICQVRPFADAYYQSSLFPWSSYITGTQGKNPGYDPMAYMIEAAHKRDLQFHAWLNPYRISSTTNPNNLSSDHIARKWWNDESTKRRVLATDKGLYFNPTIPECQKLIIDGVREIVNNYNVDGIHIDDYFYPTTDLSFDSVEYNKYKSNGGNLSQADWRRANVSTLVQGMYQATHSKSGMVFGVSPSYNFDVNYNEQYADLKYWMKTAGYIDYIVPQIYFGYNHSNSKAKYTNCLNTWVSTPKLSSVKLYIGLGAYKIGYATDGGSNEWTTDKELLAKQAIDAKAKGSNGIFIFNYSTLYANTDLATAQRENLKKALKSFE